jgi:hypothetical protein
MRCKETRGLSLLIRFNAGEPPLHMETVKKQIRAAWRQIDFQISPAAGGISQIWCQEQAVSRLQNCLKPVIVRSGRKATIRRK